MTTLKIEMPPKMIPMFAPERGSLRYRVFYGGRGSGKSFNVAKMALVWGAIEPLRILCVREFENSIKLSFHAELKSAVQSCEWLSTQYDVGVDYLRHKDNGTEFIFKGLARNIQAIKSMAQIDLVICEESETISADSWRDLLPTIRAPKSEFHIIFNPMNRMSWVAQTFLENEPPPRSLVCKLNYNDNPFFSMELEEQRQHAQKTMTAELYSHVWEGEYLEAEDGTIIRRSWIMAAIDAHLKLSDVQWGGATTLGFDVADDGADKCATATMKGSILIDLDEWKGGEDEIVKSTSRALSNARKNNASHIGYDAIGVGASVGSHLNEIGFRDHYKFIANEKVAFPDNYYNSVAKITNKDMFKSLKDQSWWNLADRFRNTYNAINNGEKFTADEMISISSDINKDILYSMINELSTPLRDFDSAGRVVVESKGNMKKRGANSPNIADSFVIASARSLLVRKSIFDYV